MALLIKLPWLINYSLTGFINEINTAIIAVINGGFKISLHFSNKVVLLGSNVADKN